MIGISDTGFDFQMAEKGREVILCTKMKIIIRHPKI